RDPAAFETRCMFLGTALLSSDHAAHDLAAFVEELTETTAFGLALRRWLAAFLGCEPTKEAVVRARDAALRADAVAYARRLLDNERVRAVIADEGYPQPTIPREEFERALGGVRVHRVGRIEPWILEAREAGSFDGTVGRFEQLVEEAAADPSLIAFKTIIAYRTGLDITDPPSSEAKAAYERWRADGWNETREHAKPVRDFLFPLLVEHQDLPIVLIHAGYPWLAEAAYVASVLPNVYLEISELVPWGWGQIDRGLELILGAVPGAKVFHGSDEASEPEMFWASARLVRASLERVLGSFVERDWLTKAEAERIGRGVLG